MPKNGWRMRDDFESPDGPQAISGVGFQALEISKHGAADGQVATLESVAWKIRRDDGHVREPCRVTALLRQ